MNEEEIKTPISVPQRPFAPEDPASENICISCE